MQIDAMDATEGTFPDAMLLRMVPPAKADGEPVRRFPAHACVRPGANMRNLNRHILAARHAALMRPDERAMRL
ncbi:hypothetical protein ASE49_09380 [Novosphingobium sp. Leaf2]|nr:hypothetical protein ASE49_09380 [Novosphingobium sp. Leaf2]